MTEAAVETEAQPKVEGKMAEFIDWIEQISVLELSKLVKALEDRLGVSAAAPMPYEFCPKNTVLMPVRQPRRRRSSPSSSRLRVRRRST